MDHSLGVNLWPTMGWGLVIFCLGVKLVAEHGVGPGARNLLFLKFPSAKANFTTLEYDTRSC